METWMIGKIRCNVLRLCEHLSYGTLGYEIPPPRLSFVSLGSDWISVRVEFVTGFSFDI